MSANQEIAKVNVMRFYTARIPYLDGEPFGYNVKYFYFRFAAKNKVTFKTLMKVVIDKASIDTTISYNMINSLEKSLRKLHHSITYDIPSQASFWDFDLKALTGMKLSYILFGTYIDHFVLEELTEFVF